MAKSNILFILILLLLPACGRMQQNQSPDNNVTLEMTVEPEQPTVGPAHLIFTLNDTSGRPINDATLKIEGNMTHAGMVPVQAEVSAGETGRYVVPFEWTMGGDWMVTVDITLADGQEYSRQFPITVQ